LIYSEANNQKARVEIKIKERPDELHNEASDDIGPHVINYVSIDNIDDTFGRVTIWASDKSHHWEIDSNEALQQVLKYSIPEIKKHFSEISVVLEHSGEYSDCVKDRLNLILQAGRYNDRSPLMEMELDFELSEWNRPWSARQYADVFKDQCQKLLSEEFEYWQDDKEFILSGFGIIYYYKETDDALGEVVNVLQEKVKEVDAAVHSYLRSTVGQDSVTAVFSFPKETEIACRQYLTYFAQFLADLGIEADTEIKRDLNQTLFTVTPRSKEESLQKIRDALASFLQAPTAANFDSQLIPFSDSIPVAQWHANVMHLKSQLMLTTSILQAKDQSIRAMEQTITALNQQVRYLDSRVATKADESEPIVQGVLSVTEIEGTGFKVHLPELLRRLKRRFF
jgi:hypothetical protein